MKKTIAILLHDDPSDGVEKSWVGDTEEEAIGKVLAYIAEVCESSEDSYEKALATSIREQPPTGDSWEKITEYWTGENDVLLFHLMEVEI